MTPTLVGRWQTRVVLLATLGVLASVPFWWIAATPAVFAVVAWVAVLGIAWDALYSLLQAFRWERDWPPAFAVAAAVIEAVVIYLLATRFTLPGVPNDLSIALFAFQYTTVWVVTFLFAQGPMRVILPWWRFHGGRIWPAVASNQRR